MPAVGARVRVTNYSLYRHVIRQSSYRVGGSVPPTAPPPPPTDVYVRISVSVRLVVLMPVVTQTSFYLFPYIFSHDRELLRVYQYTKVYQWTNVYQ